MNWHNIAYLDNDEIFRTHYGSYLYNQSSGKLEIFIVDNEGEYFFAGQLTNGGVQFTHTPKSGDGSDVLNKICPIDT